MLGAGLFDPNDLYWVLKIFDFDKTLTIKASFDVDTDPESVRLNIKKDMRVELQRNGGLFAICSYIDSPNNILIYLTSIFGQRPSLLEQVEQFVFCEKRGQKVHAFTLNVYKMPCLSFPVCIITLPPRTNSRDPLTGEKNKAYHMAREALTEHGEKNLPIQTIIQYYLEHYLLKPSKFLIQFYDDDSKNVVKAQELVLPGRDFKLESYLVKEGIDAFQAELVSHSSLSDLVCNY